MRIGCIAMRAPIGIGFEMESVIQILEKIHDVYTLGVPHQRFGFSEGWERPKMEKAKLKWDKLGGHGHISNRQLISWLRRNKIEISFSKQNNHNNNYYKIAKSLGVKTVVSVDLEDFDYHHPRWRECDLLICLTHHTVDFMKQKGFGNIVYIPLWGLDMDYFHFIKRTPQNNNVHFIHTAGTGGISFRKGTPETVIAFDFASKMYENITLTIYTQRPWDEYPQESQLITRHNDRINIIETSSSENIERFKENYSLYEKGDVAIQPSKWEGQGAAVFEPLAMGLPVITTDAEPMSEFVQNDRGMLIKVKSFELLTYLSNPETKMAIVDLDSLVESIVYFAENPNEVEHRSITARKFMEENFEFNFVVQKWLQVFDELEIIRKSYLKQIIDKLRLFYFYYEEGRVVKSLKKLSSISIKDVFAKSRRFNYYNKGKRRLKHN